MASILKRITPSGNQRWLVTLRRKGCVNFCLTFDDHDASCQWINKNEDEFYKDSKKYLEFKKDLLMQMQRKDVSVLNHIVKSGVFKKRN